LAILLQEIIGMAILEINSLDAQLTDTFYFHRNLEMTSIELPRYGTLLAQNIEDPDVLGQMQTAWNNFIESGQFWALLIGLVVGYLFRSFTSY